MNDEHTEIGILSSGPLRPLGEVRAEILLGFKLAIKEASGLRPDEFEARYGRICREFKWRIDELILIAKEHGK